MKFGILLLSLTIIVFAACSQESITTPTLDDVAKTYCDEENVDSVYLCEGKIKVVSSMTGGGSRYYDINGELFSCPLIGPELLSEECKEMMDVTCDIVCE